MSPRIRERKQRKRQGSSLLDEVLEHRMLLYVLAAGATLAGAPAAQAEIVFTPSNAVCSSFNGPGTVQIDLNNDGTNDFILTCDDYQYGSNTLGSYLYVKGAEVSNVTLESSGGLPVALKRGALIGSSAKFGSDQKMALDACGAYSCVDTGNFDGASNRILGVRFQVNGETYYGWIGFRYASASGATLVGWAYETVPNKPITAGDKRGKESEVDSTTLRATELTSLELLAAGNVAMDAWCRRRAS
jgi:hypothetical protein